MKRCRRARCEREQCTHSSSRRAPRHRCLVPAACRPSRIRPPRKSARPLTRRSVTHAMAHSLDSGQQGRRGQKGRAVSDIARFQLCSGGAASSAVPPPPLRHTAVPNGGDRSPRCHAGEFIEHEHTLTTPHLLSEETAELESSSSDKKEERGQTSICRPSFALRPRPVPRLPPSGEPRTAFGSSQRWLSRLSWWRASGVCPRVGAIELLWMPRSHLLAACCCCHAGPPKTTQVRRGHQPPVSRGRRRAGVAGETA